MADRIVKVTLRAQIDEFRKGMLDAAQAIRTVGTEGEKLAQTRQAMNMVGATGLAMGAAIAAGLGMAVAKYAEFDQAMSQVEATGEDARKNQEALRQAALDAGADTVFSAKESANAIEELSKAGIDAKSVLGGGLRGALDLAAAGGLGVAEAAGIAGTTLQTFNLQGRDMGHVADLLAAGAGKAMGDVKDLSMALAQGGLVAKSTGLSIEETTAGLAAFASKGLLGSDAGTSFKTMLQRLTPQSNEARQKMDELGISAYDANGQFIGLAKFAGVLQGAMKDLTPEARNAAMGVIFGADAIRASNVLYQEGAKGIEEWIAKVDDQGYAAKVAATRLDNLKGDLEKLSGAVDTALIQMGSAADGPGRGFVQFLTGIVDGFGEMPAWGQQTVFWIGAIASAAAAGGGAFLLAVPKIAEYRNAIDTLGPSAQKAAGAIGKVAAVGGAALTGLGIATVAADLLTEALYRLGPSADEIQNKMLTAKNATVLFDAAISKAGGWSSNIDLSAESVKRLGAVLDGLDKGGPIFGASTLMNVEKIGGELGKLAATDLPSAGRQFALLAQQAGLNETQQAKLLEKMPAYRDALLKQATATGIAADDQALLKLALGETPAAADGAGTGVESLSGKTGDLAQDAKDAKDRLDALKEALDAVAGTAMNAGAAIDDAQGAINDLADAAKGEGASLQGTNDASIALRDSMRDVEKSHRDAAEAILENGGTMDEARAAWERGREAVINQRVALGESREEAIRWADQNLGSSGAVVGALQNVADAANGVPGGKNVVVGAPGAPKAQNDIQATTDKANAVPPSKTVQINADTIRANSALDNFFGRLGVNAANFALSIAGIKKNADGNLFAYANGGISDYQREMTQAFASGGFPTGIYAGGPPIHKFAERETIWEAYISGKPSQRDRNIGIWTEAGDRLGALDAVVARVLAAAQPRGGDSYTFNGSYAPTADELVSAFETSKRRQLARSGHLATGQVS